MARPLRIEHEGACYHMPNHFHLYIATPEANPSRFTPCAVRGWNGPFAPGKRAMMLVSRCDPDPGDDSAEVYLNGRRIASFTGYARGYFDTSLDESALSLLRPGRNVVAIHCHQTFGGQYIDADLLLE